MNPLNGPLRQLPDYARAERYCDVAHAVADGRLVRAPRSAPGTFAIAFLGALCPEQKEQIAQMRTIFASEYRAASAPEASDGHSSDRIRHATMRCASRVPATIISPGDWASRSPTRWSRAGR
jgi:hypothetical protein